MATYSRKNQLIGYPGLPPVIYCNVLDFSTSCYPKIPISGKATWKRSGTIGTAHFGHGPREHDSWVVSFAVQPINCHQIVRKMIELIIILRGFSHDVLVSNSKTILYNLLCYINHHKSHDIPSFISPFIDGFHWFSHLIQTSSKRRNVARDGHSSGISFKVPRGRDLPENPNKKKWEL